MQRRSDNGHLAEEVGSGNTFKNTRNKKLAGQETMFLSIGDATHREAASEPVLCTWETYATPGTALRDRSTYLYLSSWQ